MASFVYLKIDRSAHSISFISMGNMLVYSHYARLLQTQYLFLVFPSNLRTASFALAGVFTETRYDVSINVLSILPLAEALLVALCELASLSSYPGGGQFCQN